MFDSYDSPGDASSKDSAVDSSPRRVFRLWAAAIAVLVAVAVLIYVVGSRDGNAVDLNRLALNELSTSQKESELLERIANSLNHLEEFINLSLRPAAVVLDARMSSDREVIEAVCTRQPGDDEGPINVITVVSKNADFRRNAIRSGDLLRYFVLQELAFGGEEDTSGAIVMSDYLEIPIAQVVGDNELIIEGQLPIEIDTPAKVEVWRYNDLRSEDIRRATARYASEGVPPLGWEPSPDDIALEQLEQTLTQWTRSVANVEEFRPDALLETLPQPLRESQVLSQFISAETLGQLRYRRFEVRSLQAAIWLRDVSNWARGETLGDLETASALFDWTVRNIQLQRDDPNEPPRELWEVLLYGRGTGQDRAWLFAELCRQQQVTVVMLATVKDAAEPRYWLPAVLSEGRFYLFEPELGLPIPAIGREGIATLSEARANPEVLRQLDLDETQRYGWSQDDLENVSVMVVAEPLALSRRVRLLESRLAGDEAVVLSVDPSAIADRVQAAQTRIADIRLWEFPFQRLRSRVLLQQPRDARGITQLRQRTRVARDFLTFALTPTLYNGRILQFQGRLETVVVENFAGLEDQIDSHQEARRLYTQVRLTNQQISQLPSPEARQIALKAKRDATYWIGLLNYDDARFEAVEEWFKGRILDADPESEWRSGAHYNLARLYERQGRVAEAIELYEQSGSPQRYGDLLRARWLREADRG